MARTITVTQADIDAGRRGHCVLCPVGLALWRATGEQWEVGLTTLFRKRSGEVVPQPPAVKVFITAFDGGQYAVEPFTFALEVE